MAVERYSFKGVGNGSSNTGFWSYLASIVTKLKSMYDFVKVEEADYGMPGESSNKEYAKFYVTDTCGFSLCAAGRWTFVIKLFSADTVSAAFSDKTNNWEVDGYYFNIAATAKGLAFNYHSVRNNGTNNKPNERYVLYIGDITTIGGEIVKGCVCDNDGALTIATDNGVSTEPALGTTISAGRKAVLVPVANTVTGDVFNDIFIMRYSPVQYGAMEIEGKGVYLCGKTLCLKDSEEV